MEYQFGLFDQWATRISYGSHNLPELNLWDEQLREAKQAIIKHFTNLHQIIEDGEKLKLYVLYHYQSLQKLILDVSFVKDIYKELLLKSLEQIRFYFELKYGDMLKSIDNTKIVTTLSVEEFAYMTNTLIECDVLKVKSKKALAKSISKLIYFAGSKEKDISSENFYNALFMSKPITLNGVLRTLGKVQISVNKSLRTIG